MSLFNFDSILSEQELREQNIKANKQLRKNLNDELRNLCSMPRSRERALAITKLEESIMWIGKELGRLRDDNPYPESFNPDNVRVAPIANELKK